MGDAANRHAAHIQRLRVDGAVDRIRIQLAEPGRADAGWRQDAFGKIGAGSLRVVTVGENVDLGFDDERKDEECADDDREGTTCRHRVLLSYSRRVESTAISGCACK